MYKNKYLKYKHKYVELKKLIAGMEIAGMEIAGMEIAGASPPILQKAPDLKEIIAYFEKKVMSIEEQANFLRENALLASDWAYLFANWCLKNGDEAWISEALDIVLFHEDDLVDKETQKLIKKINMEQKCNFNFANISGLFTSKKDNAMSKLILSDHPITVGCEWEVSTIMIGRLDTENHKLYLPKDSMAGKFENFWDCTFQWKDDYDQSLGAKLSDFAATSDTRFNPTKDIESSKEIASFQNDSSENVFNAMFILGKNPHANNLEFISTVKTFNYNISVDFYSYLQLTFHEMLITGLNKRGFVAMNLEINNKYYPCLLLKQKKDETNVYVLVAWKRDALIKYIPANICNIIFRQILTNYTPQLSFGPSSGNLGNLLCSLIRADGFATKTDMIILNSIDMYCNDTRFPDSVEKDIVFALLFFRMYENINLLFPKFDSYHKASILYFPKSGNMKNVTKDKREHYKKLLRDFVVDKKGAVVPAVQKWLNKMNINTLIERLGNAKKYSKETEEKYQERLAVYKTKLNTLRALKIGKQLQYQDKIHIIPSEQIQSMLTNHEKIVDFILHPAYYDGFWVNRGKTSDPIDLQYKDALVFHKDNNWYVPQFANIENHKDIWNSDKWIIEKRNHFRIVRNKDPIYKRVLNPATGKNNTTFDQIISNRLTTRKNKRMRSSDPNTKKGKFMSAITPT